MILLFILYGKIQNRMANKQPDEKQTTRLFRTSHKPPDGTYKSVGFDFEIRRMAASARKNPRRRALRHT